MLTFRCFFLVMGKLTLWFNVCKIAVGNKIFNTYTFLGDKIPPV